MIKKLFGLHKESQKPIPGQTKERRDLIEKVEKGTDFAIREYKDVFKKLAEYDKSR